MIHFGRFSRIALHKKLVPLGICLGVLLSFAVVPFMDCQRRQTSARQLQRRFAVSPVEEDFEPVLNLQGKPKTSPGSSPEKFVLVRPRFYSTELEIREKLLVAVLSTPETIETFGVALNHTLSKYPSKVVHFCCASDGNIATRASSVIHLADANCDGIAFHAIRHLFTKNTLKDYDFVFLVKDSTYVNGEKLFSLASHLSISRDVFMGRTSFMVNHCDLDAGILLSNGVFHKVAAAVGSCEGSAGLKDENLGECIRRTADLRCTNYMMGQMYHTLNLEKDLGYVPDPSAISTRDFSKAVTVFPVLTAKYHYRLHHYFSYYNLNKVHHQIEDTESSITDLAAYKPSSSPQPSWPVGVDSPLKPSNRFDVLRCVYFNDSHFLWSNDHTVAMPVSGAEKLSLDDIRRSLRDYVKDTSPGQNVIIVRTEDGYKTFDPTRGLSYTMDVVVRNQSMDVLRRLEILRPLSRSEIVPMPYVTEHTRVVMVLFAKEKELDHVTVFIEEYAKTCLEKNENTMLLLAFLQTSATADAFANVRSFALSYSDQYRRSNAKIATLTVQIPDDGRTPSDFVLIDLIARKLPAESLVLLCQTGMEIRTDYLNRVRMNTIAGIQAFLPIPFAQYHPIISEQNPPAPDYLELKKENGFFDSSNYNHFSFYLSDYRRHRALIAKEVPLAHSSTDLRAGHYNGLSFGIVELFLVSKQVHLLRATEPGLRLRYIWRNCDDEPNIRAVESCKLSSLDAVGSKSQMAKYLLGKATRPTAVVLGPLPVS